MFGCTKIMSSYLIWRITMDYAKEALKLHREKQGKIEINSRVKVENEQT